jgi:DNA-binding GntR family transcriptional regulator
MSQTTSSPPEGRSLSAYVYQALRESILDGRLPAESRIVISQVAKQYGVSLIPVREALARLNADRMVSFRENHGYRVASKPDRNEIQEWMEARLMFETTAAKLALPYLSPQLLERLRALNLEIREGASNNDLRGLTRFVDVNDQFHSAIVETCQNRHIVAAYRNMHYGPQLSRLNVELGLFDIGRIVQEHDAIIAALESGDPDRVQTAVSAHISDGLGRVVEAI